MKDCRLVKDFLLPALNNETYGELLQWDDVVFQYVFKMKWTHKSRRSWKESDCAVFAAWDVMKGRPQPVDAKGYVDSKQRLRAALRNIKTIQEVENINGFRKYRFTDLDEINELPKNTNNEKESSKHTNETSQTINANLLKDEAVYLPPALNELVKMTDSLSLNIWSGTRVLRPRKNKVNFYKFAYDSDDTEEQPKRKRTRKNPRALKQVNKKRKIADFDGETNLDQQVQEPLKKTKRIKRKYKKRKGYTKKSVRSNESNKPEKNKTRKRNESCQEFTFQNSNSAYNIACNGVTYEGDTNYNYVGDANYKPQSFMQIEDLIYDVNSVSDNQFQNGANCNQQHVLQNNSVYDINTENNNDMYQNTVNYNSEENNNCGLQNSMHAAETEIIPNEHQPRRSRNWYSVTLENNLISDELEGENNLRNEFLQHTENNEFIPNRRMPQKAKKPRIKKEKVTTIKKECKKEKLLQQNHAESTVLENCIDTSNNDNFRAHCTDQRLMDYERMFESNSQDPFFQLGDVNFDSMPLLDEKDRTIVNHYHPFDGDIFDTELIVKKETQSTSGTNNLYQSNCQIEFPLQNSKPQIKKELCSSSTSSNSPPDTDPFHQIQQLCTDSNYSHFLNASTQNMESERQSTQINQTLSTNLIQRSDLFQQGGSLNPEQNNSHPYDTTNSFVESLYQRQEPKQEEESTTHNLNSDFPSRPAETQSNTNVSRSAPTYRGDYSHLLEPIYGESDYSDLFLPTYEEDEYSNAWENVLWY